MKKTFAVILIVASAGVTAQGVTNEQELASAMEVGTIFLGGRNTPVLVDMEPGLIPYGGELLTAEEFNLRVGPSTASPEVSMERLLGAWAYSSVEELSDAIVSWGYASVEDYTADMGFDSLEDLAVGWYGQEYPSAMTSAEAQFIKDAIGSYTTDQIGLIMANQNVLNDTENLSNIAQGFFSALNSGGYADANPGELADLEYSIFQQAAHSRHDSSILPDLDLSQLDLTGRSINSFDLGSSGFVVGKNALSGGF